MGNSVMIFGGKILKNKSFYFICVIVIIVISCTVIIWNSNTVFIRIMHCYVFFIQNDQPGMWTISGYFQREKLPVFVKERLYQSYLQIISDPASYSEETIGYAKDFSDYIPLLRDKLLHK